MKGCVTVAVLLDLLGEILLLEKNGELKMVPVTK
jgi:hypothetical protein